MLTKFKQQLKNKGEIYLGLRIRSGATNTQLKQVMADDSLKIDVAAAPVKGRANLELIKFLAKEFAIPLDNVKLIAGKGEASKLVKLIK